MGPSSTPRSADVFCAVVDNFGDAGVCWRLARMLATEHALAVRLWIDAPHALARMLPDFDATLERQRVGGVEIRIWRGGRGAPFETTLPDLIVEAFGCGLPEACMAAMEAAPRPPLWINLEYLSAEAWVAGCHGLPSPQPRHSLVRYFFFPGFSARTGGLLRERGLLALRDAAQADSAATVSLLSSLRVGHYASDALKVSLFAYAQPALGELLEAWARGERKILCLVPEGVLSREVEAWSQCAMAPGNPAHFGNLHLQVVPFQSQDRYDALLCACDLNFVRGEDSFVRAQWAARPLVWQAYPQPGGAQGAKLDAFESRYVQGLDRASASAWRGFCDAWNSGRDLASRWPPLLDNHAALQAHSRQWAASCALLPELCAALVRFAAEQVQLKVVE